MIAMASKREPDMSDDDVISMWGHVLEGTARVNAAIETHLGEIFDVPTSWFEVLLRLHRTPGYQQPMTQLANEVSFSSGGFTKLADRMEEAGYLARSSCPNDRRVTWIALTELGTSTIRAAMKLHAQWLRDHVIQPIGRDSAVALSSTMQTLRDSSR